MKIILNGEDFYTDAKTVSDLLKSLAISTENVAVEINLKIIKKSEFDSTAIKGSDVVEIINFVGGG